MTEYENYQVYDDGDQWTYNPEMERLFKDRVVKGQKSQRPSTSDAPDNAIYIATDEDKEYRNDPTNGWVEATSTKQTFTVEESLTIEESGTDPSTDGEMRLNNGRLKFQANGNVQTVGMPSGMVQMWSGTINDIPSGWTLCDGTHPDNAGGVPDLQNKFVTGAGASYSVGATGGSDSVTLSESELPSHDHTDGTLSADGHTHNVSVSSSGHDHHDGTLDVDSHAHGNGSLEADLHKHVIDKVDGSGHSHGVNAYSVEVEDGTGEFVLNNIDVSGDITGSSESTTTDVSGNTETNDANISGSTSGSSPNVDGRTGDNSANVSSSEDSVGAGVSGSTGSVGSGSSHENRPQYYAIAYIYKL